MTPGILKSKLLTPRLGDTIERKRLYSVFDELANKKLVAVTAGAGYGKSTLTAQALKNSGVNTVWYQMDPADSDLLSFINYLIDGLQKYLPLFGGETFMRLAESQNVGREKQAVFTTFLCELETAAHSELVIVLDDYHLVQDNPDIKNAVSFFLDHLPPQIHLVLISRLGLNLPLSRLRAKREILEIDADALAFSALEIQELYETLFDIGLNRGQVEILRRKTSGWIACLILFYHSLKNGDTLEVENRLMNLKGSQKIFFNYLQENVYEMLPEDQKEFLLKTSILSRMDVGLCDDFLITEQSKAILTSLEDNHLFTFSLDDDGLSFVYHHLFREFLQEKLTTQFSKKDIAKLNQEAAKLYEKAGEFEIAMEHYLSAGQIQAVCRLVDHIGTDLARKGRLQFIEKILAGIDKDDIDDEPWLQYMNAQSLALSGKANDAGKKFEIALNEFRKKQSVKGEALCLLEIGRCHHETGDIKGAESILTELISKSSPTQAQKMEALSQLAFISSYLGNMEDADRYYHETIELLPDDELVREGNFAVLYLSQSYRYHFSGDFNRSIELAEQARVIFEKFGIHRLSGLYYQLMANKFFYMGHFAEGLAFAQKGLKIAEERGFQDNRGWLLFLCATNSGRLGDIDSAVNYAQASRQCFQELSNLQGQAGADLALVDVYILSGNYSDARKTVQRGLAAIKGLILPLIEGELIVRDAEIYMLEKQYEKAFPLLADAEKILTQFKWYLFWIYCFSARCYLETGQIKLAEEILTKALLLSETYRYDYWMAKVESRWCIGLLVEMAARGKSENYIEQIFSLMGPEGVRELENLVEQDDSKTAGYAKQFLEKIPKPASPGLRVNFLGRFCVYAGNKELFPQEWKNRNAIMLFKFLVYFRAKGYLSKELLMELLWPDDDPDKTVNRFHVTMSALRKALEPDLKRGKSSSYILSHGDTYQIVLGENGAVDTEVFLDALKTARAETDPASSLRQLLKAEPLYTGDFLEEDPYIEWCTDERELLKKAYLSLLLSIMEYYDKNKDHDKCIVYGEKYLSTDQYDEKVYRFLMGHYAAMDNRAMVIITFKRCQANIEKGLDCPLSPETQETYDELVGV